MHENLTHEYKQTTNFIRRAVFIPCQFQLAMNHEVVSTELDLLRYFERIS